MKVFDLHCDTVSAIYQERKKGGSLFLNSSSLHLDLEKMRKEVMDWKLLSFSWEKEIKKAGVAKARVSKRLLKKKKKKQRKIRW